MASPRSPVLGFNHEFRHRGRPFHVQTEDSGVELARVVTQLFSSGTVVATRRMLYDAHAEASVVRGLMQAQHKAVLRELKDGVHDERIRLLWGEAPIAAPAIEAAVSPAPIAAPAIEAAVSPAPIAAPAIEAAVSPPPVFARPPRRTGPWPVAAPAARVPAKPVVPDAPRPSPVSSSLPPVARPARPRSDTSGGVVRTSMSTGESTTAKSLLPGSAPNAAPHAVGAAESPPFPVEQASSSPEARSLDAVILAYLAGKSSTP
ncbi:MAG: hypothetical protein EXR73_01485 [Myxococcales bacterium]|nr:hypothetical protein [Myxococcales bacterium]